MSVTRHSGAARGAHREIVRNGAPCSYKRRRERAFSASPPRTMYITACRVACKLQVSPSGTPFPNKIAFIYSPVLPPAQNLCCGEGGHHHPGGVHGRRDWRHQLPPREHRGAHRPEWAQASRVDGAAGQHVPGAKKKRREERLVVGRPGRPRRGSHMGDCTVARYVNSRYFMFLALAAS